VKEKGEKDESVFSEKGRGKIYLFSRPVGKEEKRGVGVRTTQRAEEGGKEKRGEKKTKSYLCSAFCWRQN